MFEIENSPEDGPVELSIYDNVKVHYFSCDSYKLTTKPDLGS